MSLSPFSPLPAFPAMGRRRVTADELLARAEANGYKKGKHKEKDAVRNRHKCCAQQTGMHILVVEALLIIYLFYLGSELILIDIRKPFRSSTCLVRYSWSLSS